ncbi:hypothetical protein GIB67_004379 [Kingdonia uniflora]|uniref:DUF3730 domain-containing protein n=1 Tax=Kingdonia uniflora TaxID=39325 RepID=A0A7J7MRB2_9MAGN|nr:hypothetical protein GIB67_004379 [Kingdonia uniflora]
MDSYTLLLERLRVPQPSLQKLAVISIFENLRSAPPYLSPDSDPGRLAITQCLNSNSAPIIDQSVRELCRLVKNGFLQPSRALLELQSALEGSNPNLNHVFVKGIGFIVRFDFNNNGYPLVYDDSLCLGVDAFVKVVSSRIEARSEVVQQVLLVVQEGRKLGFSGVCEFLRRFLNYAVLGSEFEFTRGLVSSIASLACSFEYEEAIVILKLLNGCLKYCKHDNAEEFKNFLELAGYLVDAYIVVLRKAVEIGLPIGEVQLCGVEVLETLLSLCTNLDKQFVQKESILELSKNILAVQKELHLQYIPELSSVTTSLFIILTLAEFEHEQLSILKLSIFLLKWKRENEHAVGKNGDLSEDLLFVFPVVSLLSSSSRSIMAAGANLLALLEELLIDLLVAQNKVPAAQGDFSSGTKSESIIHRLLQHLWSQEHHSPSSSYFFRFISIGKTGIKKMSWVCQLREYCLIVVERQKSRLLTQSPEIPLRDLFGGINSSSLSVIVEMPLLLSSIVAVLVMHPTARKDAMDSLAVIGIMDPKLKLLEILPSLASHSSMTPLILQTILPMLQRDAKLVLRATANRLLCKTWEVTDRVFGSLQAILHPNAFKEFVHVEHICLSMAASIRDVCRKNPDRGVDLILSVSACIESQSPIVQALGFQSLGHLCEADVIVFSVSIFSLASSTRYVKYLYLVDMAILSGRNSVNKFLNAPRSAFSTPIRIIRVHEGDPYSIPTKLITSGLSYKDAIVGRGHSLRRSFDECSESLLTIPGIRKTPGPPKPRCAIINEDAHMSYRVPSRSNLVFAVSWAPLLSLSIREGLSCSVDNERGAINVESINKDINPNSANNARFNINLECDSSIVGEEIMTSTTCQAIESFDLGLSDKEDKWLPYCDDIGALSIIERKDNESCELEFLAHGVGEVNDVGFLRGGVLDIVEYVTPLEAGMDECVSLNDLTLKWIEDNFCGISSSRHDYGWWKANLVVLQETKLERMGALFVRDACRGDDIGWCDLPSVGTAGGVIVMLDKNVFNFGKFNVGRYSVSVGGNRIGYEDRFVFSGVYGPNENNLRQDLWDELEAVKVFFGIDAWCIRGMGDFNVIRFVHEKNTATRLTLSMRSFGEFIQRNSLLGLLLSGGKFTGSSNEEVSVLCRLDWCVKKLLTNWKTMNLVRNDFYTAWNVIAKHALDYYLDPIVAHGVCCLLRWGAMDAEAYSEASKNLMQILWKVGTSRHPYHGSVWVKARCSAFVSLTEYEVVHIQNGIPDFKKKNAEFLISEENPEVLSALEGFEDKIITFEHITRRRLIKEKRVANNKVEKFLDVFTQVIFPSGKSISNVRDLPGAALVCLSFTPKVLDGKGTIKDLPKLHAAYENALVEIAESLHLSRNLLIAQLSLQSWITFMQRWMKAVITLLGSKVPSNASDKTTKAADDILKKLINTAEKSIPRSAENIALAICALCMVLPPSAHEVTASASKFLLKWLFEFEHEHRQWSSAVALGYVSSCLHATDHRHKFQIISGLLKVSNVSKNTLVIGACGFGLGIASQHILIRVEVAEGSSFEETSRGQDTDLLAKIVVALSTKICQLSPSSFGSLQSLCNYFLPYTKDASLAANLDQPCNDDNELEEDVWAVAGLVLALGNVACAIYQAGHSDAVLTIKDLLRSWIPHINPVVPMSALSVGSCLALPMVVAFCQRIEIIGEDELNYLVNGYKNLISELLCIKKSGIFHQSLLMASCIGAGNLLSCILDEGVYSLKADNVKSLLELFRKSYSNSYPPSVHFGGMLGVVNALGAGAGAGAGTFSQIQPKPDFLQTGSGQKESSYVRGPILATTLCEPLSTLLIQEMFLVAQDSKNIQLQNLASWAIAFLKHCWWYNNKPQSNSTDAKSASQTFPEDSAVWQLCLWLMDLNCAEGLKVTHINTVATVLRCLSRAPRLPSLDWGVIIRRCMRYEEQVSGRLPAVQYLGKQSLREECIKFALAHANHVNSLLLFLDELCDLSRFKTLELNLKTCLLCHLLDLIKVFSGSRIEKLFDDISDYFRSTSEVYNMEEKNLLRVSFWSGLYHFLDHASSDSPGFIANLERCMESLFALLPSLFIDGDLRMNQENSEWSEVVKCLGKARRAWVMDLLEVSDICVVEGRHLIEIMKRIQARTRLVMTGCIQMTELLKLKAHVLNLNSDGIWDVLVEVVWALQSAEGSIKRQWLVDAVEISCITKYPSTALQFLGLLSGSCCKYMPLLLVDRVAVLNDLAVTLPSLLSDTNWMVVAENVTLNLWKSTERIYEWARCLPSDNVGLGSQSIDDSERSMAALLMRVTHRTCVSLRDYLPLEKQLRLANMVVP